MPNTELKRLPACWREMATQRLAGSTPANWAWQRQRATSQYGSIGARESWRQYSLRLLFLYPDSSDEEREAMGRATFLSAVVFVIILLASGHFSACLS